MNNPVPGLHCFHCLPPATTDAPFSPWRVWLLPLLCLPLAAWLMLWGDNQGLFLDWNRAASHLPAPAWAAITSLGDTLPAFAILLPLILRRPDAATAAIIAVVMTAVGIQVFKHLFDLPRPPAVFAPELFQVIGPALGSRAFPSGHTAAAFTLAALIAGHTLSRFALWPLLFLACLIGFSRIAVGVHWPADVFAGAAIGWLSGFAALHLVARCSPRAMRLTQAFAVALFTAGTLWLLTGFDSGYADARWIERGLAIVSLSMAAFILIKQRFRDTGYPS